MTTKKIKMNYHFFLMIFLLIQPILDVSYAVGYHYFELSFSLNTIARLVFLCYATFYLLFICKDKKTKIMTITTLLYCLCFLLLALNNKGSQVIIYEARNTISTFFFPLSLMYFINIYKEKKIYIEEKYFVILSAIYLFFIIVPNILGLGFDSYNQTKEGLIGWFFAANAVGCTLTILLPICMFELSKTNKKIVSVLLFVILTIAFFSIGTKTPIIGLAFVLLSFLLWFLIKWLKEKKTKNIIISGAVLLITIVVALIMIPKTTFYKNIKIHLSFFDVNSVSDVITNREMINQLVFSRRLSFWDKTKHNYQQSKIVDKVFGIGYIENYSMKNENRKMIEIDYFDVFYRHGIIGFIIYFLPIISVIFLAIKKINVYDLKDYSYWVCITLMILLAFFCGHIFVSPSVSVIICYLLANCIKEEKNEKAKS